MSFNSTSSTGWDGRRFTENLVDKARQLGIPVQRVFPSGARSFALDRMTRGRRRFATLGSADTLTIPEARAEARRLIVTFADIAKKDGGPRTLAQPMEAFAAEFLDRQARHWKPQTLESNAYMVRKYILPAFGHLTVDTITVEHVKDWFASMAERPGSANRAMPILSVMMRMAELWGYRPHNSNPCKNTRRYRMEPKARFLTAEEMARLNAVLTRDEFYYPQAVAVIRLLMLTGCRFGEVVSLEWDWIPGKRIHLPDAKSGPRTVWLSSAARAVIDAIPRYSPDCPFLFPARPPTRHIDNIEYQWHRIHDIRHSFASRALALGEGLPIIGRLLGHRRVETTARYAHLARDSVRDSAERIAVSIAADIL